MIRSLFSMLAGYALAAPFTPLISFDLRETEWTLLLTHLYWALGVCATYLLWFFLLAMFIVAGRVAHEHRMKNDPGYAAAYRLNQLRGQLVKGKFTR